MPLLLYFFLVHCHHGVSCCRKKRKKFRICFSVEKKEDEPENDRQMRNKMFIFLDNILSFLSFFFLRRIFGGFMHLFHEREKKTIWIKCNVFQMFEFKSTKITNNKIWSLPFSFWFEEGRFAATNANKNVNDYGRWKIIIRFQQATR